MAKKKASRSTAGSTTGSKLIETYGLHWHWENVHLGGGRSNKGKLLGHRTGAKKIAVDFADQRGIYALYAGYDFVYAGQIGKRGLLTRLKEHRSDDLAERWDRFSFFGTRRVLKTGKLSKITDATHPAIDLVLDQLEAFLIYVSSPTLNNSRGKWRGAVRYYQIRDERLGPTTDEMVEAVYKAQKKVKPKKG